MYSRKQFFRVAASRCFDWVKTVNSFLFFNETEPAEESTHLTNKSLYFEAMRLGIDPGTLKLNQLIEVGNIAKESTQQAWHQ